MDSNVHEILQARILEWVAFPFSRGSSKPRDQTQVSCTTGRLFTSCATREARGKCHVPSEAFCDMTSQTARGRALAPHPHSPTS